MIFFESLALLNMNQQYKEAIVGVFVDFQKVFDTVNHRFF